MLGAACGVTKGGRNGWLEGRPGILHTDSGFLTSSHSCWSRRVRKMARGQRGGCWVQNQALGFRRQPCLAPSATLLSVGDSCLQSARSWRRRREKGESVNSVKGGATGV